jgi:hypothetical protein
MAKVIKDDIAAAYLINGCQEHRDSRIPLEQFLTELRKRK